MAAAMVLMATAMVATVAGSASDSAATRETARPVFLTARLLEGGEASSAFTSFTYSSTDASGAPGMFCDTLDEAGNVVASEVLLDATDPTNMTFVVGPENTGAGYLVRGRLAARDDCAVGLCGTFRAGFVCIHSTIGGTWQTGQQGLAGVLHLRLFEPEMHVDQKITWTLMSAAVKGREQE